MRTANLVLSAAIAALLTANAAEAGQLFVANLNGANETPATTSPFTGTAYFVLDNSETTGTYWAFHNIDNTLTGGEIRRGSAGVIGSRKYTFQDPTSPAGPEQTIILNPAIDNVLLRSGSIYANFLTTAFPNGAIRGQFVPYYFAPQATNRAQTAIANMLDNSAGTTLDLDNVLVSIANSNTANQVAAFDELSGRTLYAQSVEILDSLTTLQDTLFTHAAEANPPRDNFVAFAKAGYVFGTRQTTIDQAGAKIKRPYFMAGVDARPLDNVVVGIAVGYTDATDTFRANLGKTNVTTTSGLAYVSATVDRVVIQAVGQYGSNRIETTRKLSSISRTATSSHGGNGWSIGAKISAPFHVDENITVGPYLQLDTQYANVHAYTESGANAVDLVVPSYKDKDIAGELGAALQAPLGKALSTRIEAGWHQPFDKGGKSISTSLAGSPVSFNTLILGRSPTAARFGLAISSDKSDIVYAEAGYRGFLSGRMTIHAIEARLAIKM